MKKIIIATVIVISTFAFTSCSQQNAEQTKTAMLADKANLGQADFTAAIDQNSTPTADKANLGQADYNAN